MYAQVEKSKENKGRAIANWVAQKKTSVKQCFSFVDNRPATKNHHSLQLMMEDNQIGSKPISRLFIHPMQMATVGQIRRWRGAIAHVTRNWDKRLDSGNDISAEHKARNVRVLRGALRSHGKPFTDNDVIDFSICINVEISSGLVEGSTKAKGYVYEPDAQNLTSFSDIGRVIRGAGEGRNAPNTDVLHHHNGGNISDNIIYKEQDGVIYVLGSFGHHMTTTYMRSNPEAQRTVTRIAQRNGPWAKVIRYGTRDDVAIFDW